jgi:hypothetical protein
MGLKLHAGVAAGLSLAASAAAFAATPGADPRSELTVAYSATAPAQTTGVAFHVLYKHPSDSAAKPPPLTKAAFELPAGTRIDNGAVPQCEATDDEFQAMGRDACPAASKVGEGTLTVMTGSPTDPTVFDSTAFNGKGEIVELVTVKGTNTTAGLDRQKISGSTLTANPPALPGGPPDGRTAVREIVLALPARADNGRPYIVTPGLCDASGGWQSRGTFEFNDGGRSSVVSSTPCTPAQMVVRPARTRLRAGRSATLALSVQSSSPDCREGVLVRLGRASARTDAAGTARMRVTLYRLGRATVRAGKPGCARALAPVRVTR